MWASTRGSTIELQAHIFHRVNKYFYLGMPQALEQAMTALQALAWWMYMDWLRGIVLRAVRISTYLTSLSLYLSLSLSCSLALSIIVSLSLSHFLSLSLFFSLSLLTYSMSPNFLSFLFLFCQLMQTLILPRQISSVEIFINAYCILSSTGNDPS